jgi:hypothetical protein
MDEKTRELRDLFVDMAGEETVTEHQQESRGSLASGSRVDDRLADVVDTMRERYAFRSNLPTAALIAIVRGFFAGHSDAEIAASLDDEPAAETVARARIDLHLVTERDREAPFDLDALREALDEDRPLSSVAADLGIHESTARRYRHVLEAERQRRAVNDRYREDFERLLADRDLSERLTEEVRDTGLEDATDGMETNVSF